MSIATDSLATQSGSATLSLPGFLTRLAQRMAEQAVASSAFAITVLLLVADVGFIGLYVIHSYTPLLSDSNYSLSHERGFAETFQYIKEYWLIVTLLLVAVRARHMAYLVWAVVFAYLLYDDAFQWHESAGTWLVEALHYPSLLGLRPQDLGELTTSALAGVVLFPAIALSYWRASAVVRHTIHDLAALFALLLVFGVGFDLLQIALSPYSVLLTIADDGGEMMAMSLLVGYAAHLFLTAGREPIFLVDRVWTLVRNPRRAESRQNNG